MAINNDFTILEVRNRAVEKYESEKNQKDKEKLGAMIAHFDDMVIAFEISCLGPSKHIRYFDKQ